MTSRKFSSGGTGESIRFAVGECSLGSILVADIPCYRVVRKNGALAGYRWGIERTRTLLEREARV
jgi:AraC family transcriptional regulator, regulatory protein of adaptative response / methylated-DNA-[protein]-cysteine methyltransferase